uniref:Uncharacterized protein n=1 Tax=Cacopsylla melanoneura TaxID=428564 RepID=A0A8D8R8X0_9HEMI
MSKLGDFLFSTEIFILKLIKCFKFLSIFQQNLIKVIKKTSFYFTSVQFCIKMEKKVKREIRDILYHLFLFVESSVKSKLQHRVCYFSVDFLLLFFLLLLSLGPEFITERLLHMKLWFSWTYSRIDCDLYEYQVA